MTHIKRIDEYGNGVMYRNDNYGEIGAPDDPVSVIAFEMGELGNSDIPDYCIGKYGKLMDDKVLSEIRKSVAMTENGNMNPVMSERFAKTIVSEMERIWGIKISRVKWLADYDTVADLYCDDESEKEYIKEYETSDYILCDLGGDGVLFAYPEKQ